MFRLKEKLPLVKLFSHTQKHHKISFCKPAKKQFKYFEVSNDSVKKNLGHTSVASAELQELNNIL